MKTYDEAINEIVLILMQGIKDNEDTRVEMTKALAELLKARAELGNAMLL